MISFGSHCTIGELLTRVFSFDILCYMKNLHFKSGHSSGHRDFDKTTLAIYSLVIFILAAIAVLIILLFTKPSDDTEKSYAVSSEADSDTSSESTSLENTSLESVPNTEESTSETDKNAKKPADPYENLAVANITDALNLREEPNTEAKVIGTCFRGGGGTILKRKDGWTKIRSGGLEGWLKDDYLVFGDDIKPLAKELGLYIATVSTQTLNVREEASTESAIVGLAAAEDYYPVLSQEDGWVKIQLSVDTSGYVSSDYVTISVKPGRAISIEDEMAALEAAKRALEESEEAERAAKEARIAESKAAEEAKNKKNSSESSSKTSSGKSSNSGSSSKNGSGTSSSKSSYVISASESDVYLLSACLTMEADGGSYDSYLAVGSVIVNRVKSGKWGNSVSSVIYADGQFPGATSGLLDKYMDKGPSATATKAAKAALSGDNNIGDYLYFTSTKSADYGSYSSYQVVGGNCFYKK